MSEGYIYRFDNEGCDWSRPMESEEECIRCALIEQLEECTNFEYIEIAEFKKVDLPKIVFSDGREL